MEKEAKAAKPKNILDLNSEEKQKLLDSFDLFLSDCDGVLWRVSDPIDGAGEAINLLKNRAGKKCGYISNNSVRSEENYLEQFRKLGIEAKFDELFQPIRNVIAYLKKIKFNGLIYVIGSQLLKDALSNAGYQYVDGPNKIIDESYRELARHVFDKQPVKCVIMDTDFNISGTKLIKAQLYLKNPDTIFLCGATDFLLPVSPGVEILGPGGYVKLIEQATQKKAILLGKPGNQELCEIICDAYKIKNRTRVLMVGDMLDQDVGFGKLCGFQTLLVLTGGSKLDDFDKEDFSHVLPDYYAESIADFKTFFESINKL